MDSKRANPWIGASFLVLIAMVTLWWGALARAQEYPAWFLYQGSIPCKDLAVGYATLSYYPDSALSQAFHNACLNHARQSGSFLSGSELFWNTGGSTTWMGNTFQELSDSAKVAWAEQLLKPLASYQSGEMIIVAAGIAECITAVETGILISLLQRPRPEWVETLPHDHHFVFSVGAAPGYYFEISSWLEAEARARRELAKSVALATQSMQKMSGTLEEMNNEEVDGYLTGFQVMERWRDIRNNLFYVLLRMQR